MLTLYGPAMVAQWCGVGKSAVSNWLARYSDYPPPLAQVVQPDGSVTYLWTEDQKPDWLEWQVSNRVT